MSVGQLKRAEGEGIGVPSIRYRGGSSNTCWLRVHPFLYPFNNTTEYAHTHTHSHTHRT